MTIAGSTLTGASAQDFITVSQTYNTTGAPNLFTIAATDTAQGSQTSYFRVQKDGLDLLKVCDPKDSDSEYRGIVIGHHGTTLFGSSDPYLVFSSAWGEAGFKNWGGQCTFAPIGGTGGLINFAIDANTHVTGGHYFGLGGNKDNYTVRMEPASTDTVVQITDDGTVGGGISTPDGGELTIATGVVSASGTYHTVDTESDAATDDLDTINGGVDGMFLVIQAENDARTVVAKDGTGNLQLNGDFSLDNAQDTLTLLYSGALSAWVEISRSDNGA